MAKLKKTATEIKQYALFRKYKRDRDKKAGKGKQKKNPSVKEDYNYLRLLPYKEFLATEYWKKVRIAVLTRDGYKCMICSSKLFLNVHHDTYKNRGRELKHLGDLITLCRTCHKEHHYAQK